MTTASRLTAGGDRVVVLRHGMKVADLPSAEVDEHRLIELIVGVATSRYAQAAPVSSSIEMPDPDE